MKIKDRIKQLRVELGLTQEQFANKIGFSRTAISAWEIGRNEPSNDDTIKLAVFFGVSTDYLLGNSDIRNPETEENDTLGLAKIGFSMDKYNPPTEKQKEQIRDLLEIILKDNKKDTK